MEDGGERGTEGGRGKGGGGRGNRMVGGTSSRKDVRERERQERGRNEMRNNDREGRKK